MEQSRWASPSQNQSQEVLSNTKSQQSATVPNSDTTAENPSLASSQKTDNASTNQTMPTSNHSQLPDYSLDPADEFAQTRPPDDLFSDEFTPISDPIVEALPPTSSPTQRRNYNERGSHNSIGTRGRGGLTGRQNRPSRTPKSPSASTTNTTTPNNGNPSDNSISESQVAGNSQPAAVRGPRHLTGGPALTKLSDADLTARIAAIRLKNDQLIEKHARASADEQQALERENKAAERMIEERKRKQELARREREERGKLDQERERNRERKAKAMGIREWDMDKETESQENYSGRGRGARRGMNGGIVGGRGRGRGGIRGGLVNSSGHDTVSKKDQEIPKEEDFPALGTSKQTIDQKKQPTLSTVQATSGSWADDETPTTTIDTKGKTWADEMNQNDGPKAE